MRCLLCYSIRAYYNSISIPVSKIAFFSKVMYFLISISIAFLFFSLTLQQVKALTMLIISYFQNARPVEDWLKK